MLNDVCIWIYIYISGQIITTSLRPHWEWWLVREIIPKWPYFRLVNYYNLPIYIYIDTVYIFSSKSIRGSDFPISRSQFLEAGDWPTMVMITIVCNPQTDTEKLKFISMLDMFWLHLSILKKRCPPEETFPPSQGFRCLWQWKDQFDQCLCELSGSPFPCGTPWGDRQKNLVGVRIKIETCVCVWVHTDGHKYINMMMVIMIVTTTTMTMTTTTTMMMILITMRLIMMAILHLRHVHPNKYCIILQELICTHTWNIDIAEHMCI